MDQETERALVRRLADGDPAAFDAIYAEYRGRLFSFLARLSRRPDVAEDLAEETWLRLVTHARRLRPDTRLGAWLFTVARNLYFSYCRSRLLDDANAAGLLGLWPVGLRQPSPFDEAVAGELERRVGRALQALAALRTLDPDRERADRAVRGGRVVAPPPRGRSGRARQRRLPVGGRVAGVGAVRAPGLAGSVVHARGCLPTGVREPSCSNRARWARIDGRHGSPST